jgi:hypothetical protein
MNQYFGAHYFWLSLMAAAAMAAGCTGDADGTRGIGGTNATAGASASPGSAGSHAAAGSGGMKSTGGVTSSSGASGAGGPAQSGTAGDSSGGSSAGGLGDGGGGGNGGSSGAGGSGNGGSGGSVIIPEGCNLSTPVSFKKDVRPFLTASCSKAVGGGCHVTDAASTMNSLCPDGTRACGFDHAYDWITAGSHNEFCNQNPAPIRFTVVVDVMKSENPATCTQTRIMPPPGMGAPATPCQMAALEAWLALPKVLQVHRADDTSPAEPYLMPPYN